MTSQSVQHPLLVAGDGSGLVQAAGDGLIDGSELIQYSASLDPDEVEAALDDGAVLLVTDSNRKRGERWTTVRHTRGFTETEDGGVLDTDLTDNRLPEFPDQTTGDQTIAVNEGDVTARATSYGNPITFTAEERPAYAVDGDFDTAWRTAAFTDARGERLVLSLDDPITTDEISVTQPTTGARDRFITKVRLTFDDADTLDVTLSEQSRDEPGQVISFPERSFSKMSVEILADTVGNAPRFASYGSVGFSEITLRRPARRAVAGGRAGADRPARRRRGRLARPPADVHVRAPAAGPDRRHPQRRRAVDRAACSPCPASGRSRCRARPGCRRGPTATSSTTCSAGRTTGRSPGCGRPTS